MVNERLQVALESTRASLLELGRSGNRRCELPLGRET